MEDNSYQNMKVWRTTLGNLRQIYAITGEKMVVIVDRLVKQELERLRKEQSEKGNQPKPNKARKRLHLNNEPLTCEAVLNSV
jgi:hypothetical protein